MKLPIRPLRLRAAGLWRALWPALVVVAGAVTCDAPTSVGHRVSLALAPVYGKLSMTGFAGMTVDSVRLTVVRPPSDTISKQTFAFSPDSSEINAQLSVQLITSHEQLIVLLDFLAGSQVLFTGTDTVDVTAGGSTTPATIPIAYIGPGNSIAALHITPRDSGATFGSSVPFTVTATDSSNANVPLFYVSWSTSRAGDTINAAGLFRAGNTRGLAWVRARTPSGIWDSARIAVVPVANAIVKVSGDAQSGPVSAALSQQLVVRVLAADNLPVVGVPVQFAAASGGGSVNPALVATDTSGKAAATATFGANLGVQTFTATIQGTAIAVTFSDTALNAHGVPTAIAKVAGDSQVTTPGAAVAIAPKVKVTDAFGAAVAGATVTFAVSTGGGSVTGGTVQTDAQGFAQVGSWTLGPSPSTFVNNTLTASATGTNSVSFAAIGRAFANVSIALSNVAGVGRVGALVVRLSQPDVRGDTIFVVSDSTQFLRIATPGLVIFLPGDTIKTIADTGIAAGTAGVRVFGGPNSYSGSSANVPVTTNLIGLPASVSVSSGGTTPVAVTLSSPAPGGGILVTLGSSDTTKAKFTTPTVTVPASSTSVNATVQGVAAGATVLFAGSATFAPATAPVTVVASSIASTVVSPHLDTLTALSDTVAIFAQAKDGANNNVAGTFTFTSRAPSIASVTSSNAVGHVTAVANGSTYVVATEAGGTRDSVLIVVQQRIATIAVTPATRTIYLSRTFTFSAAAVDGRGNPIASVTTFNWSTTAAAVATVDTSVHTATTLVTAAGLGTAQIRATSGAVIGVSNVSVLTPITRIAVVVDTVGAFKTDTFTQTSLGLTRRYRAVAHDTLDAVMSGVSFTFASTNPSVAVVDSTHADTAFVRSVLNGITTIRATAQGFTSNPGAFLTVSQVLASIELKPDTNNPTATIGIGGTLHVTARGKDANSRYISGGSFVYHSATTAIATVDSLTGLVSGVANGTSNLTATSGATTSNVVVVTVGGAVPAIISFGRDTVAVGRGASASIPILLSKPALSNLIVKLTSPAFAHWQGAVAGIATVTIPQGQTSVNATLLGDSAGTTTVTATDSSGLGYAGASAVLKVTANMQLASGSYSINATDIVTTQVLLSDPSPAGGTYVTFSYTKSGVASVSPDPAFIPQGQLAADIQIRGLTGDTTHITPVAAGVNGLPSYFQAYAPVLTPAYSSIRLGAGQYEDYVYVYTPTYTNVAVPVTLTSSDTTIATVPPLVTIPGGSNYAYFRITAKATGSANLTVASPGWTAAHGVAVTATTPRVGICCNSTLNTTSPNQNATVYAEDSTGSSHYRVSSLVVHLRSTDTLVMKVLDTVVTIAPDAYYTNTGRVTPTGGGTAYVVATASGHLPDSVLYTVVGPKLQFNWSGTQILGTGQYESYNYIYTPDYVTAPLIVSVSNSNPTSLTVPGADTIPTSTNYHYFDVRGNVPGSATLIASAQGYQPDTAFYTVSTPRITVCCNYTYNNFGPGSAITVYSTDSTGTYHYRRAPLSVTVTSLDPSVMTVDSATVTIDSGTYYNQRAHVTPVGVGVARIVFSAAGHISKDTLLLTVSTPKLYVSLSHYAPGPSLLGRRQHYDPNNNGFYVSTPDYRPSPLAVTITQKHGSVDSLTSTSLIIPTSNNYQYLDAYGLANGTDTIIASAPGYFSDTVFIRVTTPAFTSCCMPSTVTTTQPPFGITVYATDSTLSGHYTMDTVVVKAVPSDSNVIRPAQPFFRILKNTYYTTANVNVLGPGTASMTYSDSALTGYTPTTTGTITVTGPSFGISNGTPVLGMRQTGGPYSAYVYTQNNVSSPLVVHLLSTSIRVVTVTDSVIIPTGYNYAYFQITAQDTLGTIQIQASATGYTTATSNVQVTQPKFVIYTSTQLNTTSPKQTITVYATDANGNAHPTTEKVTVTLASSAPSVASIDSATVSIDSGNYQSYAATWAPGIVGTSQLSASDTRAVFYKYNSATVNVAVITPSVNFSWGTRYLGIGQYDDYAYAYTPDNATAPTSVAFSHVGSARASTYTNLTTTPITGVTIPASYDYQYFRIAGASAGTDSLVATIASPVHNPDTAFTIVAQGRVDPIGSWPSTIKVGDSLQVRLYARDATQGTHYVLAPTTFTLAPDSHLEFRSGGVGIASVQIPADQYYVDFYVKGVLAGTGGGSVSATNYQTYSLPAVTVTP